MLYSLGSRSLTILLTGSLLLAVGCAKPPTQEMADADAALTAATEGGAAEYASDQLSMAQEIMADAMAKLESKDYKGAKTAAVEAKAKAEAALAAVEPNKQAMKAQVEEHMATLKPAVDALHADAMKLKGKEDIKTEVGVLVEQWETIQADLDGGDYLAAMQGLDEAQVKHDELREMVDAAAPAKKK